MTASSRRDDLRQELTLRVQPYLEGAEDYDTAQARYDRWFHLLDAVEDAELERVAENVWYEFSDCDPGLGPDEADPEWISEGELRRRIGLYLEVLAARWPDPAPPELVTPSLVLRPLTVGDNDMDYAALMEARDFLCRWDGRGWPAAGFSLVENRDDLERHELEHRDGVSLTYTVLASSRSECLGCVYVRRLRRLLLAWNRPDVDIAHSGDEQAAVSFWMRPSRRALEKELLEALRSWPVERPFFYTNENCLKQTALFESAGLRRRMEAACPGVDGPYLLYA